MVGISYDKVRIGIALGGWPFPEPDPHLLWDYTERMESLDVDSIWFTDRIVSPTFTCLLYTSDAADDTPCVDLGGRRII